MESIKIPYNVNNAGLRKEMIKEIIPVSLDILGKDIQPLWGKMSSQYMVEHLAKTFLLSVGKFKVQCVTPEEKRKKLKSFLHTNRPMPKGFKNPTIEDELSDLRHQTIDEAKQNLKDHIRYYSDYYKQHPDASHTHPVFGILDASEWEKFHFKHSFHHLSQFGLITKDIDRR